MVVGGVLMIDDSIRKVTTWNHHMGIRIHQDLTKKHCDRPAKRETQPLKHGARHLSLPVLNAESSSGRKRGPGYVRVGIALSVIAALHAEPRLARPDVSEPPCPQR